MLGNSILVVFPCSVPRRALKDSPVHIPEPSRRGTGLTWGRRDSFSILPNLPCSPCPAVGDGTSMCAPTCVCSGECRGVERDLRPGGKWYCFSLLPQLEELARAAGRVCGAGVLAASRPGCTPASCLGQAPVWQGNSCPCGMLPPQHHPVLLRLYSAGIPIRFSRGRENCCGVEFPQSCSASSFHAAAWLPCSESVISLFLDFFLRVLLAVGCPVPWGHPPCTCQLGGGKHLLWVLFACYRGSFAEGSRGLLHLESTGACWSGLAVVTGCPSAAACPGHAPRDTFTLPQPRLPRGDTQCHPQLVRRATCFSANKI